MLGTACGFAGYESKRERVKRDEYVGGWVRTACESSWRCGGATISQGLIPLPIGRKGDDPSATDLMADSSEKRRQTESKDLPKGKKSHLVNIYSKTEAQVETPNIITWQ